MGRQTLWHVVLIIAFIFIGYELIEKGFFAYPYFKVLSESNKTTSGLTQFGVFSGKGSESQNGAPRYDASSSVGKKPNLQ